MSALGRSLEIETKKYQQPDPSAERQAELDKHQELAKSFFATCWGATGAASDFSDPRQSSRFREFIERWQFVTEELRMGSNVQSDMELRALHAMIGAALDRPAFNPSRELLVSGMARILFYIMTIGGAVLFAAAIVLALPVVWTEGTLAAFQPAFQYGLVGLALVVLAATLTVLIVHRRADQAR